MFNRRKALPAPTPSAAELHDQHADIHDRFAAELDELKATAEQRQSDVEHRLAVLDQEAHSLHKLLEKLA